MKPETAKAIRTLDVAKQRELVRFLAELMTADDFCDALESDVRTHDLAPDGREIMEQMAERHMPDHVDIEEALSDIDRLHEAICEGRRQDAIDILNAAFPTAGLRSASAQDSLFPDRKPAINITDLF